MRAHRLRYHFILNHGLFLALAATGLLANSGTGQITFTNRFSDINRAIPDGVATGLADSRFLSFTNEHFSQITNVQLTLTIEGGFNGDLYAYLVHEEGFAILLNREGRTSGNRLGYSQSGLDITFADGADDLHFYETFAFDLNSRGQLTGTWAPDGRRIDPDQVSENASPTAMLSSFNGLDPNGAWTLFVADLDFGEQGTLKDWSLIITAVPEPAPVTLFTTGPLLFLALARKARAKPASL